MLLCAQYILPVSSEPIIDGAVLVRDGVIRDIGKAEQLRLRYPEEEVVDQGLAAVMPGLVDLHTRLEQSVLRGVVNDAPYVQWLAEVAQKSGAWKLPTGSTPPSWAAWMLSPAASPRWPTSR